MPWAWLAPTSNNVDWQFAALAVVQLNIEYEAIACDGFLNTFINI